MKNIFNMKISNPKVVFVVLMISLFVIFLLYYVFVFSKIIAKNQFANQMIEISDKNENPIFTVQKVLLYSSATSIDKSEDRTLKNMSVCQFTDLSIYLDNLSTVSELTNENTIKELYIDNIKLTSNSDKGNKFLNYKNALYFGKFQNIVAPENDRIDFNIINTNSENENQDYSKPTFYTDCSNPITLGYLNSDIVTNYSISSESNVVSYNGKVLQEANIPIEDINYTLNFKINIVNNLNEKFEYNFKSDVNLDGIYDGYTYKGKNTSGNEYKFFKVN